MKKGTDKALEDREIQLELEKKEARTLDLLESRVSRILGKVKTYVTGTAHLGNGVAKD